MRALYLFQLGLEKLFFPENHLKRASPQVEVRDPQIFGLPQHWSEGSPTSKSNNKDRRETT